MFSTFIGALKTLPRYAARALLCMQSSRSMCFFTWDIVKMPMPVQKGEAHVINKWPSFVG